MKRHITKSGIIITAIIPLFLMLCLISDLRAEFNPCDLIDKAELEALAREKLSDPEYKKSGNPLGQSMCLFNGVESSRLIQISVIRTVDILPAVRDSGQSAKSIFRTTREMFPKARVVTGIGESAFWATPGLHILHNNSYILISVGNTDKAENLDLAGKIAGKILPGL